MLYHYLHTPVPMGRAWGQANGLLNRHWQLKAISGRSGAVPQDRRVQSLASPEWDRQTRSVQVIEAPLTLETARLVGRPANNGDMGYLRHILGSPQCMRWLSPIGQSQTDDQMVKIVQRLSGHWQAHGFGVRLFFQRGGGAFAGWCGLRYQQVDGRSEVEILYALRHSLWRRGLGSEMAKATLKEGVNVLGFRRIVAFTVAENVASQGVMRACGMTAGGEILFAGHPHVLFSKEWASSAVEP